MEITLEDVKRFMKKRAWVQIDENEWDHPFSTHILEFDNVNTKVSDVVKFLGKFEGCSPDTIMSNIIMSKTLESHKPDKYQKYALETWAEHTTTQESINHAFLGLSNEVGELLGLHKKNLYKPNYSVSRDEFLDELGDCFYYLVVLASEFGVTINELAKMNKKKLKGGHGWVKKGVDKKQK